MSVCIRDFLLVNCGLDKPLLDLYADYPILSFGPTTATGLSRLLSSGISHDRVLSHDKITRFLSERTFTSADLWHLVKPLVRKVQSDEAVLVIDDSIAHKPHTDASELIGWHYDHTTGTSVKGINFLTTLYCTADGSLPVAFALVAKDEEFTDAKTGKPKRRASVSKNAHYRTMLKACVKNGMPFRYVLNDVWFAAADNMKLITPLKPQDGANQGLRDAPEVQPQRGPFRAGQERWPLPSSPNARTRTRQSAGGLSGTGGLPAAPGQVLLVKQVFTNKDNSQGLLYLVTSDRTLDGDRMMTLYQERWQVEKYHKSLKQNASLACSPTRTKRTQTNHFFLSLCAFVKLEGLKITTQYGHFALKQRLYLAALQAAFAQLQTLQPSNLLGGSSA